ncbi:MAG TPA: DUF4340 domain-containing protein [Vicinamibacterales bacterium]|nr:DUF4340 domain-containing protein [Vicinamibacterales bacterium]
MRGLTTTILLVLVLAGLGAYIYFVDSERPAGGVEDREKVFAVEADQIEEITVSAEGDSTTLRRADGVWQISAPVTADADPTEVSSLATALAGLEINRVLDENASNLADYGLADPRIKIAFRAEGGTSGELHIGETTPTRGDMYAVKAGESRVFLVAAYQESSFAKSTFDLRDKRILHFERDKIDTIELTQPGSPAVQLARAGNEWTITAPVQARGDYSAVEGLVTRLSTASMTELVDANSPESFGLEAPSAVVTIGTGSARATLELGAERDATLFARDRARQLIFKVEPSLATDVKKTVDELRDKDLFEFRTFNALGLRVSRGADTYEFQKVAGGGEGGADKWQRVVDGKPTDIETTTMEDFLAKLSALRAESFSPTTNAERLASPALVVGASYDSDKYERVRLIPGEPQAFAVRDGEPGVAVLDSDNVNETIKAFDLIVVPTS